MNGQNFQAQYDFFFSLRGKKTEEIKVVLFVKNFEILKYFLRFSGVFKFIAVHVHIHGMLSTLHMLLSNFTVFKIIKYLLIAMMLIAIWGHTF